MSIHQVRPGAIVAQHFILLFLQVGHPWLRYKWRPFPENGDQSGFEAKVSSSIILTSRVLGLGRMDQGTKPCKADRHDESVSVIIYISDLKCQP